MRKRRALSRGAGGPGYYFGRARDVLSGIPGKIGGAIQAANNSRFGQFLGKAQGAGLPLALSLPYISSGIESLGGTADQAAAGSSRKYRAARGASGAIQGALTGGFLGFSVGGAVGGAVGAVGGGLVGVVASLRDAEKDIRQVKIGEALTGFADKLASLSSVGVGAASPSAVQAARRGLDAYRVATAEQNRSEATGLFTGFDLEAYQQLQSKSLRQDFGQQLPALTQSLQKEADRLGRKIGPVEDGKLANEVDTAANRLREGGAGLHREFINIIANVRDVSVDEVLKEFRENILQGQKAAVAEREALSGRQAEERSSNDFSRLALAVHAASDSLAGLRQRSQDLADLFEGNIGGSSISARVDGLSQFGRLDKGALRPLDIVAAYGGQLGGRLRESGGVVDEAARILPGIISAAVAASPPTPNMKSAPTSVTRSREARVE